MSTISMPRPNGSRMRAAGFSKARPSCRTKAGSFAAVIPKVRRSPSRASEARMASVGLRRRKSAGLRRGEAFRRKADWSSPGPEAGRELRIPKEVDLPQPESTGLRCRGRRFRERLVLSFRPGDVVGDEGHDRYSGHAHKDLREQRARADHQLEMSDE